MLWCMQIVEKVAMHVTVRAVAGIEKCAVIDFKGDAATPALQTDGVNFEGIWMLADDLDLNRLTTNNIASMLEVSSLFRTCMLWVCIAMQHRSCSIMECVNNVC